MVPLLCGNCGLPLEGDAESSLFVCSGCGLVHEPGQDVLGAFPAMSAAITTDLAASGDIHYLAVWRMRAPSWERIHRATSSGAGYLYVPAFTLVRPMVQRLGVSLCLTQPELELTPGLLISAVSRPSLVGAPEPQFESWPLGPGFGAVSPVVVSRQDAKVLAQFVYLAVESHETHDLHPAGGDLAVGGEELVFIPAVWDPRYIHESNWRLLLSEFDDLVA